MTVTSTQCVIVGGGPGGMVLALLLARQGVEVVLLEAHANFEREFRGDTMHPSTLELMDELGLLERVLDLRQSSGYDFPIHTPDGGITAPVQPRLPSRFGGSTNVPQAAFLHLLAEAAAEYPNFRIEMGARVEQLIEDDGAVRGVRYRATDGWHEVRAQLVVGADGRFSKVRQLSGKPLIGLSQGFDVLWLKLPQLATDPPRAYGLYPRPGLFLVISDRVDTWQIGIGFPKGAYQQLRDSGIEALRERIAGIAPFLADRVHLLQDWSDTSLLVVQAGHVRSWHRPGLLLIGDAAHVMSPVFGVGINYAIQDAVVAANVLGPRLRMDRVRVRDLAAVQWRREWPTRIMLWMQKFGEHQNSLGPVRSWRERAWAWAFELPPMVRLRTLLIAFAGLRPERVRSGSPMATRGAPGGLLREAA